MAGEWPLSAHPSCLIPVSSSIFHGGGQGGAGDLSLSRRGTQPTLETGTTHCQLFQNRIVLGISWEDVTSCPHLQGGSWVGLLCPIVTPPLLPTETLGFSQTSHTSPVTTCTQQVPNKRLFTEGKNNVPSITLQ